MIVQGASGREYRITPQRIYELDGWGRPRRSTCWWAAPGTHWRDEYWAMRLALQLEEHRVLTTFPWRNEHGQDAALPAPIPAPRDFGRGPP